MEGVEGWCEVVGWCGGRGGVGGDGVVWTVWDGVDGVDWCGRCGMVRVVWCGVGRCVKLDLRVRIVGNGVEVCDLR